MQIELRNCNNIESALVSIDDGRLNIKYAMNGTGKSTVAKALECTARSGKDLSSLTPFKYMGDTSSEHQPSLVGAENINSIMVFSEGYINQFAFREDEVLQNSFNIFIRTPDYDQRMEKIDGHISSIRETFKQSEDLDKVISHLTILSDSFGKSKGGYSESGALAKGLGKGNRIKNIPKGLESYAEYLNCGANVKWIRWQIEGNSFSDISEKCPYCTSPSEDKKEMISKVAKEYDAKSIEHLNNILKVLSELGQYFSAEANERLLQIANNSIGLGKEGKSYLLGIKEQIETLRSKMLDLKGITYFSLKDVDKLGEHIAKLKIDLGFIQDLNSESTSAIVDSLNGALDQVLGQIGKLQGEVNQQNRLIQKTIEENSKDINEFLNVAGYKYYVDAAYEAGLYKLRLRHVDYAKPVSQATTKLSYGEKNAFALVLFMYECLNKNPDLVVLDDPISSFDKNKKYAVLDMLFRGSKSLRNKTTLMMTHDLEPVIDIMYNLPRRFSPPPKADFLCTKSGVMRETPITKSDIATFGRICDENVALRSEIVVKLVYLRRYFEILDNKGDAYQLLSNLLHKRSTPILKQELDEIPMSEPAITNGKLGIREKLPEFEYALILEKLNDEAYMKSAFDAAEYSYEKLQIFRVMREDNHKNDIIKKFINEAFHIENEYVMQVNPCKYDTIPEYIVEECKSALESST